MPASARNVTLALIAAAAPILSGVAAVYHERNVAAAVQAKRDEALLKALMDCIAIKQELAAPAPAATPVPGEYEPAPPPPPTAEIRPRLEMKVLRKPTATDKLDAIARENGWTP